MQYSGGVFDSWETPRENTHTLQLSSVRVLSAGDSSIAKNPVINDVYDSYTQEECRESNEVLVKRAASSEYLKCK